MSGLEEQHRFARYNVELPTTSITRERANTIPQSLIAQKLESTLIENSNENKYLRTMDCCFIVCNSIILAFQNIYNKYICSSNAAFMINISGKQRKQLMQLLDRKYYYNQMSLKHSSKRYSTKFVSTFRDKLESIAININITPNLTNNYKSDSNHIASNINQSENIIGKKNSDSKSITTYGDSTNYNINSKNSQSNSNSNSNSNEEKSDNYNNTTTTTTTNLEKSKINVQLEKYMNEQISQMNKGNPLLVLSEEERVMNIYKWLLKKLILLTEESVYEISKLMKDSFIRFKNDEPQLFEHLVYQKAMLMKPINIEARASTTPRISNH